MKDQLPLHRLFIELTGGEVTLCEDLPALARGVRAIGARIGVNSNASRSAAFWADLSTALDHVVLTFHVERGNPDRFLEVVAATQGNVTTSVTVVMHPERFDECLSLARRVSQLGQCSVALQPVLIDLGPVMHSYPPEQLAIMRDPEASGVASAPHAALEEHPRTMMRLTGDGWPNGCMAAPQIVAMGLNRWRSWRCYAGVEQLVVSPDGMVARAWCDPSRLRLGHIEQPDFRVPRLSILCHLDVCPCFFDVACTKRQVPR